MADLVKIVPFVIFGIFMTFTVKDLFFTQVGTEATNKEIPNMNLGPSKYMGPVVKILYCYSCGYKNAFEEYSYVLSKRYPDMIVEGSLYPPPGYNSVIARGLSLVKLIILVCIISGADFAQYMGRFASSWNWCLNNKFYSCIMIFLICNMIEGQLISTGAFEITFNDVPIWSKLETGRIPQPPELFQIIDNQLQFQGRTFEPKPADAWMRSTIAGTNNFIAIARDVKAWESPLKRRPSNVEERRKS